MKSDLQTSEFIKTELEQTFNDIRSHYTILLQISTVLILADITIISYSLTVKISGLILIWDLSEAIRNSVIALFFRVLSSLV